jgi:threonine dehydratase
LVRKLIDEVVLVDVDQMCVAVKDLFDDTRGIAEPSGALAVVGMKIYAARKKLVDKTLIAVNSGANVNLIACGISRNARRSASRGKRCSRLRFRK